MTSASFLLLAGVSAGFLGLRSCQLHAADTTCRLYLVREFPTEPRAQQPGRRYLLHYEVLDSIQVPAPQQGRLRQLLAAGQQLATDNQKRCPFVGKYGIEAGRTVAVLSASPCAKLLARTDTAAVVATDLPLRGELELLLEQVAGQPGS